MNRPFNLIRRQNVDRRGATAVELGLLAPLLFLLLLALVDFGRLGFAAANLDYATQEGARYASLHPAAGDEAVRERVLAQILGGNPADILVPPPVRASSGGIATVTVTATHEFRFISGLVGLGPITLTGRSTLTVL